MSNPGPVTKKLLRFSYIRSEDSELDINFDETELKNKSDYTSNIKVKFLHENIMVIEEEFFACMNLTGVATFPTDLV